MADVKSKQSILIYTEVTPNPETMKFVTNRMLYKGTADFDDKEIADKYSPLAIALYELDYVKSVYISNNFVTVTKELTFNWNDIMLKLKQFIKDYIESGKTVVNDEYEEYAESVAENATTRIEYSEEDKELVKKIKELIDTYVKPAVEVDGGNIEFHKFKNGKVYVEMQGACSGCPSSTVTLKSGIEGMLKRMVPQVEEVVTTMG